jgi:hypothetical protein
MAVGVSCAERLTSHNALCLVPRRLTIVLFLILIIGIVYILPPYRYLYSIWHPNHHRHIPDQITILSLQARKRSLRHSKNRRNRRNTSPRAQMERCQPWTEGYGLWSLVGGGTTRDRARAATIPGSPAQRLAGPERLVAANGKEEEEEEEEEKRRHRKPSLGQKMKEACTGKEKRGREGGSHQVIGPRS